MTKLPSNISEDVYIHPSIRFIHDEVMGRCLTYKKLSEDSGIGANTMRKWRKGESVPNIYDLELVLRALGAKIEVRHEKVHD